MRITVGMINKQYQSSLNKSLGMMNYYNNRATTFRKFEQAYEDPASAAVAFRLRREYEDNDDYQKNLRDATNLFLTAESSIMSINKMVQEAGNGDCIQAITGTTGEDERKIIAKKLREVQGSILSTANAKFADSYMFGGSNTTEPPFSLDANGNMLYRGVDVTTGLISTGPEGKLQQLTMSLGSGNQKYDDYNIIIKNASPDPTDPTLPLETSQIDDTSKTITLYMGIGQTSFNAADLERELHAAGIPEATVTGSQTISLQKRDPATGNLVPTTFSSKVSAKADLDKLAKEEIFTDLGLGLKFSGANNELDRQSAFNIALPGIDFLGYGQDANGIPNNMYALLGDIADQLEKPDFSIEQIQPYLDNFKKQEQNLLTNVTGMGTKSTYMEYAKTRLTDAQFNLNTKMIDVEEIDPATAIMDFKMQEYAYRAALQMGMKVLQPTFLDFMQ